MAEKPIAKLPIMARDEGVIMARDEGVMLAHMEETMGHIISKLCRDYTNMYIYDIDTIECLEALEEINNIAARFNSQYVLSLANANDLYKLICKIYNIYKCDSVLFTQYTTHLYIVIETFLIFNTTPYKFANYDGRRQLSDILSKFDIFLTGEDVKVIGDSIKDYSSGQKYTHKITDNRSLTISHHSGKAHTKNCDSDDETTNTGAYQLNFVNSETGEGISVSTTGAINSTDPNCISTTIYPKNYHPPGGIHAQNTIVTYNNATNSYSFNMCGTNYTTTNSELYLKLFNIQVQIEANIDLEARKKSLEDGFSNFTVNLIDGLQKSHTINLKKAQDREAQNIDAEKREKERQKREKEKQKQQQVITEQEAIFNMYLDAGHAADTSDYISVQYSVNSHIYQKMVICNGFRIVCYEKIIFDGSFYNLFINSFLKKVTLRENEKILYDNMIYAISIRDEIVQLRDGINNDIEKFRVIAQFFRSINSETDLQYRNLEGSFNKKKKNEFYKYAGYIDNYSDFVDTKLTEFQTELNRYIDIINTTLEVLLINNYTPIETLSFMEYLTNVDTHIQKEDVYSFFSTYEITFMRDLLSHKITIYKYWDIPDLSSCCKKIMNGLKGDKYRKAREYGIILEDPTQVSKSNKYTPIPSPSILEITAVEEIAFDWSKINICICM